MRVQVLYRRVWVVKVTVFRRGLSNWIAVCIMHGPIDGAQRSELKERVGGRGIVYIAFFPGGWLGHRAMIMRRRWTLIIDFMAMVQREVHNLAMSLKRANNFFLFFFFHKRRPARNSKRMTRVSETSESDRCGPWTSNTSLAMDTRNKSPFYTFVAQCFNVRLAPFNLSQLPSPLLI